MTADKIADFLDRISLRISKRTFVVLDNASVYRYRLMRELHKHLCPFLALTQRCSSQDCGIATLGKLHQLADKDFLLGCRWYVMQYLILLRSVDTDVLGSAKIANLRIKSSHE